MFLIGKRKKCMFSPIYTYKRIFMGGVFDCLAKKRIYIHITAKSWNKAFFPHGIEMEMNLSITICWEGNWFQFFHIIWTNRRKWLFPRFQSFIDISPPCRLPPSAATHSLLGFDKRVAFRHWDEFASCSVYICDAYNGFIINIWWIFKLSLIHIWRCRRYSLCRSRWSPYH